MKRFSLVALILALVMSLCVCFTACGDKGNNNNNTATAKASDVTKELNDLAPALATAMLGVSEGEEYQQTVAGLKAQFATEEFQASVKMMTEQVIAPAKITAKELDAVVDVVAEAIEYFMPRINAMMQGMGGGSGEVLNINEDEEYVEGGYASWYGIITQITANDINKIKEIGNDLLDAIPAQKLADMMTYLQVNLMAGDMGEGLTDAQFNTLKTLYRETMDFAYAELRAFLKIDANKVIDTLGVAMGLMSAETIEDSAVQQVIDLVKYWATFGGSCMPAIAQLKEFANLLIDSMPVLEPDILIEENALEMVNVVIDGMYAMYKLENNYINAFTLDQYKAMMSVVTIFMDYNNQAENGDIPTEAEVVSALAPHIVEVVKGLNAAYVALTDAEEKQCWDMVEFIVIMEGGVDSDVLADIKTEVITTLSTIAAMDASNLAESDYELISETIETVTNLLEGYLGGSSSGKVEVNPEEQE